MEYIKKTLPYFLMIVIPIIIAFIITLLIETHISYKIVTKEIQPHGEYFITLLKESKETKEYVTTEVDYHTFHLLKKGKIPKNLYYNLKGGQ